MPVTLYIAPAGYGKSRHVLSRVREATRNLDACPRICVANKQQLASWQQRLAAAGGCIGAHLMTFDDLYRACLTEAGEAYTQIGDTLEYRLLRAIIAAVEPSYYRPVQDYPGFVQECQSLIAEMKSAQISPATFLRAVQDTGNAPRLREIGQIYAAYQEYLQNNDLADYRGMGLLALDAITHRASEIGLDWSLLVLDGFASFTQTQLSLLHVLQNRVDEIIITLSGDLRTPEPRSCHSHFARTRDQIEAALDVHAVALPDLTEGNRSSFALLEENLFSGISLTERANSVEKNAQALKMLSVKDHATEVRVALRWLKQRIMQDDISLHETSLVARDIALYRSQIALVAEEYGLPVYFVNGPALPRNPCVAALFNLMRLLLPSPASEDKYAPSISRRALINTLRSPYFDWQSLTASNNLEGDDPLQPEDIEYLDAAGRWGRVISGEEQWHETLDKLAALEPEDDASAAYDAEFGRLPPGLPVGVHARRLHEKLNLILHRLAPPQGNTTYAAFVQWLETLIGPDSSQAEEAAYGTLNILSCLNSASPVLRNRDIAALRRLKEVMGSLLWAEVAGVSSTNYDYTQFYEELAATVEAANYRSSHARQHNAILVSDVVQSRGVPCRALAVMGLAEGIFPASLNETPFLREKDREIFRDRFNLPLDSAIDSHEQEYFYETVTRSREWLLLTRPNQAESGTSWEPSPFWTEVERIVGAQPQDAGVDSSSSTVAASKVELCYQHATTGAPFPPSYIADRELESHWDHIQRSASIFKLRWTTTESPFNGSLKQQSPLLHDRFASEYIWSASRLESYLQCPMHFFLSSMLGLQSREEPQEGLDARQLGNIYHRLMEETYSNVTAEERLDVDRLRSSLDEIAEEVLSAAPQREGFRETAWWQETRLEIRRHVQESLEALAALPGQFVPRHFELFFGKRQPLVLQRDGDRVLVRGIIDRIDVDEEGRLRLIDYKTAGPSGYSFAAHRDGRLLQLPLYALAAQDALKLGEVVEGFYWHLQKAEHSSFTLQKADPLAASQKAVEHAWRAIDGARSGHFAPDPPEQGCPQYCPGASFCWRYEPRRSF